MLYADDAFEKIITAHGSVCYVILHTTSDGYLILNKQAYLLLYTLYITTYR